MLKQCVTGESMGVIFSIIKPADFGLSAISCLGRHQIPYHTKQIINISSEAVYFSFVHKIIDFNPISECFMYNFNAFSIANAHISALDAISFLCKSRDI